MPKRRKNKQLNRGPWDSAHITREFKRVGWFEIDHGSHPNFNHPSLPGKVQIPSNWTGVKASGRVFHGLMAQSGYTKAQLLQVLNGLDP